MIWYPETMGAPFATAHGEVTADEQAQLDAAQDEFNRSQIDFSDSDTAEDTNSESENDQEELAIDSEELEPIIIPGIPQTSAGEYLEISIPILVPVAIGLAIIAILNR